MRFDPRQWPIPTIAGVLAALLFGMLIGGYIATRPPIFEAQVTVVAAPDQSVRGGSSDFGSVVSLTLPAMTEVARSRSLLTLVRAKVPGAPSLNELTNAISVQIVPASGVAQISVTGGSPRLVTALAGEIGQQVIDENLLAPVGQFRLTDTSPIATQVAPDRKLAAGFGLAAAILGGIVVFGATAAVYPRVMSDRDVLRVLDWLEVAVVDLRSASGRATLEGALLRDPNISILPVGNHAAATKARVLELLPLASGEGSTSPDRLTIVAVSRGDASRAELRSAVVMAYVAGWRLLAVVLV